MAFKLSQVEVESKKTHETKRTNRGKKFTIAQEKLGKLSITDRYNNQIGTFDAQSNEYKFKHKDIVEWTITTGKEWKLLHKSEPVAIVSNPEKVNIKLLGTKYGDGDVFVGFDDANTTFKLQRENDEGKFVFAVYRSDSGPLGSSSGKVEIARGERRNFVIVLACLVLFIKQKAVKKGNRQSMPVGSTLGMQAEAQAKAKRARSNSVDGDKQGKVDFSAKKTKAAKEVKESEKSDDDETKSGSKDEKKTEKKPSSRDIKKNSERAKASAKKRHTKGKGKHDRRDRKRHDTTGSSEESGSSYTRSGSDYSTSESSYTDSEKYTPRKRRSEKGRKASPRKGNKSSKSNTGARGKGRSETPRKNNKDAGDSEKTNKSSEPASSSELATSVKAKIVQVAESLEKGEAPNGNYAHTIGASAPSAEVSVTPEGTSVPGTNGSGSATTTATITIPALPQPGFSLAPTPVSAATAVIVSLSENQYLLNINGLDRSKKSNISIQLKVDGVPVAGSPWEYTV